MAMLVIFVLLIWFWRSGLWRESIAGLCALVGVGLGGWIGRGISIAATARRLFRQQKMLHRPYDVSWTAEAITLTSDHGASTICWPDFHKRRETDEQFLLFLSDVSFLMVPKRAFPDTTLLTEFRNVVTQRVAAR